MTLSRRFYAIAILCAVLLFSACNTQTNSPGDEPAAPPPTKKLPKVTIGYQSMINPWKVGIQSGSIAKATGHEIEWRKFNSGAEVITAMASGDVHIAVAGSSPIATAMSREVDVSLFWILEAIRDNEALVARNGSGIQSMADLKGKTIGVPFASTTHYHLLVALEQNQIDTKDVKILNLQPDAILAAWTQESIDAAFVWSPILNRITPTGTVLLTSGAIADTGKPTFDGMIVANAFAKENADFMKQFVKEVARLDGDYRDNTAAWNADSAQVKAIAELTGADPAEIPTIMGQYHFPDPNEQIGEFWLGGGAAQALRDTAAFLKDQKKINTVHEDYGRFIMTDFAASLVDQGEPTP
ncbi:taurine ABC transporter substrate-binding protein [Acanthopleuribacter pedis]|uniref:Taurine ABC transporter substrate-binding protein n=1 Tax=Acanthopleuribacter pedis TaxID=442870 RepID=A0A8J7U1A8_9BACT|nr:taurine ABC transporter substrate-binding protein [Acanthopleuribacter pedis]MBO1317327.1 taurine ABC transporter substrate-binding protein [Acanthopleuribacter pedis]MBO1318634.1 taurine ABC transporter substrate-binding protein [Acanthopleuribacter pedis]